MGTYLPRDFIDQVLAHINIVDTIDASITLKKFGVNYKACCPFHSEKNPSFVVSPQKQIYHCFGCGAGGNVISFLMAYEHLNFFEVIQKLAGQANIALPDKAYTEKPNLRTQPTLYDILQAAADFYQAQWKTPAAQQAKNYLMQRQLSGVVAQQFSLGYAPETWDALKNHLRRQNFAAKDIETAGLISTKHYDKFRDRIIFPIHDRQGRVVGLGGRCIDSGEPKYLNSPETPIFHKSNELYGVYHWLKRKQEQDCVIVVEGYLDVLALVQHGFGNAVGTLGTATTEQHIRLLLRYTDKIIFCFDGDAAGRKAAWRALTVALPKLTANQTLCFVFLAENEDPDSTLRHYGQAAFTTLLQQAATLSEFFIQHLVAGLNLSIADHRAKLLSQAKFYLQNMVDAELQHILCEELAHRVRIPVKDILRFLKKPQQPAQTALPMAQHNMPSALGKAIAIVVQYPTVVQAVANQVDQLPAQHLLLTQLLALIQKNPQITTATLLEYYRDSSHFNTLMALSTQALLMPEQGLEPELRDALHKIIAEEKTQQMEALITKAQKSSLNTEEKQRLKDWLQQRHRSQ